MAIHDTPAERIRRDDFVRLVPDGYETALDAGARDGFITNVLKPKFKQITAIDLTRPDIAGVICAQGDLTKLGYPDNHFDFVICSEVLEHVPDLERACREIVRVARRGAVIGVPYRQDIRVMRTTCSHCGHVSPPWGHVNSFDEEKLSRLLAPMRLVEKSLVGSENSRTSGFASWLMDRAGNPWGVYGDDQFCVSCSRVLSAPPPQRFAQRVLGRAALSLQMFHSRRNSPHPNWIHARFEKTT